MALISLGGLTENASKEVFYPFHIEVPNAETWREPVTGMEFVRILPGEFMMGSEYEDSRYKPINERPVHRVTLDGFWLARYEVTQGQWKAVMGRLPAYCKKRGDNYPVDDVSWRAAQKFIQRLSRISKNTFRLPTEAEWEYACRAGTTGDRYGELDEIAWYRENSSNSTHPVGQKSPNAWGLFDMLGNANEWVQDWYGEYTSAFERNPQGPKRPPPGSPLKVDKGACYISEAGGVRASTRGGIHWRMNRYLSTGFRLARD
jgi:formylglycine-generating enzyme required for sulfatase activity